MRKNLVVQSLAVLALLAACGGGGGGGGGGNSPGNAAAPTTPVSGTFAIATGDSLTYQITRSSTVTPVPSGTPGISATTYFERVAADGSSTQVDTDGDSNSSDQISTDINASFQEVGWRQGLTSCANTPQVNTVAKPLGVGKSWDVTYSRSCGVGGRTIPGNRSSGSVVSTESVVTPVGTFNAYKLVYVNQYPSVRASYTCWREVVTNVVLSCDFSEEVAIGPQPFTTHTSKRLVGFSLASFPGQGLTASRFAGRWNLAWGGAKAGHCSPLVVNSQGTLTGACQLDVSPYSPSTISGTVDANGVLKASLSSGTTIAGNLTSPLAGTGSVSSADSPVATFNMTHY